MVALNTVLAAGIHEHLRAEDVRLQEDLRRLDAAVDVALSGKVHDDFGLLRLEDLIDPIAVADVGFEELEVRLLERLLERGEVARISQAVHAEHAVLGVLLEQIIDEVGADEPGAAGDENGHIFLLIL